MATTKIEKGLYQLNYKGVEIYIEKQNDILGDLVWLINFDDFNHEKLVFWTHGEDSLWATKGEAVEMAKHFVNNIINA